MILVRDPEDLHRALKEARTCGRVGLDTEFLREKTYRARLCLVQLSIPDEVFVLDPLAGLELGDVAELIADPDIEVVVHAGRQDLELFYEQYDVVPSRVFDIQIAAGFAGHGASLPYGRLIEAICAVRLAKGESYSDWCRRPLTSAQLRYAADDVRYLLDAADHLRRHLASLARTDWVEEEMRFLEDADTYRKDPTGAWRRVSGRGTLSPKQLAVLKEVAAWREETARQRDIPRGWVVKDPTLVEIARRAPTTVAALKAVRGMAAGEAERSARPLLDAIARGTQAPALETIPEYPKAIQARARMLVGLADAVVRARCEAAGIATELVVTRAELEALLAGVVSGRVQESDHRLLQGWRRALAGDALVALAQGRVALRVIAKPPYIEEVWVEEQRHD